MQKIALNRNPPLKDIFNERNEILADPRLAQYPLFSAELMFNDWESAFRSTGPKV